MNLGAIRRHAHLPLLVIALALLIAGCAGAGPASPHGGRARCSVGPGSPDDPRPLFFLLCVESP